MLDLPNTGSVYDGQPHLENTGANHKPNLSTRLYHD